MSFRKLPTALAAAALIFSPVAAQAAPVERAAAPTADDNDMSRTLTWLLVAIVAGVALFLVLDGNNNPTSP